MMMAHSHSSLMERLSFDTLLQIIGHVLDDPTLNYSTRIQAMVSLSMVNKRLRRIYFHTASLDVRVSSRAFYQYWVSKVEKLPKDHLWNTQCRSFEFLLEHSQWRENYWFDLQNLFKGGPVRREDPVPYFMGNILTQKGLFPNLRTIHIRFVGPINYDPYDFLFPACLPKSVNALYLHYHVPESDRSICYYEEQPEVQILTRFSPIRFSCRKPPLDVLVISVTGDEIQDETRGPDATSRTHYTDVPIFRDITRLWGSLFDATPSLFVQGISKPIEEASNDVISLSMHEAFEFYSERRRLEVIGWNWPYRLRLWQESGNSFQRRNGLLKKRGIRNFIQKFMLL